MKETTRGTGTAIVYDHQTHHHRGLIKELMIEGIVTDMATVADMEIETDMEVTKSVVIDREVIDRVMVVTDGVLLLRGRGVTRISRYGANNMTVHMGRQVSGETRNQAYIPTCNQCGKHHPGDTCYKATCACFICGQVGHLAKDCKKGSTSSRGNRNNKPHATSGRVFALTTDQAANAPGTVSGTLYMYGRDVFVLFDTSATYSVVSLAFFKHIKVPFTLLDYALSISTPMKNNVVIGHEYRDCPLRFNDNIHSANLLPLEMSDFDIILGMDWLTQH
ncbi:putative reverse transcriptase domain-containing protein [Tanacetum coccineum]|uniref:Reverse transcriptase domain-containing protein n=1 Tax=Tanacetum coccineum TaxID=301880 RepID=A0ABQ5F237_9ASTR